MYLNAFLVKVLWFWLLNLSLKLKLDQPLNNKDRKYAKMDLWSKFGDSSLKGRDVIVRTSWKWGENPTFKLNLTLKFKVDHTPPPAPEKEHKQNKTKQRRGP